MFYHVFISTTHIFRAPQECAGGGEYENEQRRQAEKLIKELRFGCTTNIAMVINYYAKE